MARETWVIDPKTKKLVLKENYVRTGGAGVMIIRDIEPYRTAAADKQTGKRVNIGGRRQHREFLRNNGYIEYGTEPLRNRTPGDGSSKADRVADIKRALGE